MRHKLCRSFPLDALASRTVACCHMWHRMVVIMTNCDATSDRTIGTHHDSQFSVHYQWPSANLPHLTGSGYEDTAAEH